MTTTQSIRIEPATERDIPLILTFIKSSLSTNVYRNSVLPQKLFSVRHCSARRSSLKLSSPIMKIDLQVLKSSSITFPHFLPVLEFISRTSSSFPISAVKGLEKHFLFTLLALRRKEIAAVSNGLCWTGMSHRLPSIKNWGQFRSTTGQYFARRGRRWMRWQRDKRRISCVVGPNSALKSG